MRTGRLKTIEMNEVHSVSPLFSREANELADPENAHEHKKESSDSMPRLNNHPPNAVKPRSMQPTLGLAADLPAESVPGENSKKSRHKRKLKSKSTRGSVSYKRPVQAWNPEAHNNSSDGGSLKTVARIGSLGSLAQDLKLNAENTDADNLLFRPSTEQNLPAFASSKMMLLEEHNGLPIKETMKVLYSVRRMKFVWELMILTISMVLFFIITSTALGRRTAYEQQFAIQELLQDEEFEGSTYKKNFDEIRSIDEFWSWIEGPLVKNLYLETIPGAPSSDLKKNQLPPGQQDYVASYLRVVGGIQVRQFRISRDSCTQRRRVHTEWGHRLDTKDGSCFDSYEKDSQHDDDIAWAKKLGMQTPEGPFSYLYGHWGHCDARQCALGPLQDEVEYGASGSAINIPPASQLLPLNPNATESAESIFKQLKQLNFFDRSTRAIVVEFVFFNTNTETMSTALFIVEQYSSGLIESSVKYRHARISLFDSKTSMVRLASEIAFLVVFSYQFQRELKRVVFTRPLYRYFMNPFSWLEISYFTFNFFFFIQWYGYVFDERRNEFDVSTETFVPMYDVAHRLMKTYQYAGWSMLTVSFKALRLMSLNRRMSVLWQALAESAADVVAFMVSFFILLTGFGYMAYMMWGVNTKSFTTIYTSTFTLLRYWIDEFPYDELYDSQPDMYYSFFIPFSLLLTLVVQNVFVAIILNSFTKIHIEASHEHWKKDLAHVSFEVHKRCSILCFVWRLHFWERTCMKLCCNCHKDQDSTLWYSLEHITSSPALMRKVEKRIGKKTWNRYQVYSRELQFYSIISKAARTTRRNVMAGGSISSLYEYFRRAYREHPPDVSSFMSIHELCAITKPKSLMAQDNKNKKLFGHDILHACDHKNCIAAKIIQCYNNHKSVLVISGKERESKMVQRPSEVDMRAQRFDVIKTNNMGRKQARILIVDQNQREIRSFDSKMRLHVILPLKHLQQLENLEAHPCSLELSFKEGVYSYCELEFTSRHERTRFIQCIMKQHEKVEEDKVNEADKDPLVRLQRQMEDISTLVVSLHQMLDRKSYAQPRHMREERDPQDIPEVPPHVSRAAALRLVSRLPSVPRWAHSSFVQRKSYYPHLKEQGKTKRSSLLRQQTSIDKFVEKSFGRSEIEVNTNQEISRDSPYKQGMEKVSLEERNAIGKYPFGGRGGEVEVDREVKEINRLSSISDGLLQLVQPPRLQRIESMRLRDSGLGAVSIKPKIHTRSNSASSARHVARKSHYESGVQLKSNPPVPKAQDGLGHVVKRFKL